MRLALYAYHAQPLEQQTLSISVFFFVRDFISAPILFLIGRTDQTVRTQQREMLTDVVGDRGQNHFDFSVGCARS